MKKIIISFSIIYIIASLCFSISYATKENSANLQTLRLDIEGIEPIFNENIYEYYLIVPTNVENIDVTAIPKNLEHNVTISGNTNIKEGLNTIKIEVSSKDKKIKTQYKIEVTKTNDKISANTNLETLAIKDELITPPFEASVTNYETEVSNNVTNLDILAIPENEKSNIVIQGKDNLKVGNNLILINVTAPNGFTKKTYKINVKRRNEEKENKNLQESNQTPEKIENADQISRLGANIVEKNTTNATSLSIFIIGGLIFIVTVIIVIIKRKNKSNIKNI